MGNTNIIQCLAYIIDAFEEDDADRRKIILEQAHQALIRSLLQE